MSDDAPHRGLELAVLPNDSDSIHLAARFGEIATHLADDLPGRVAAIHARGIRIAQNLERVRRRLAELRSARLNR